MPSRYQWSRKAGARLPEGVVTCCRPGKWGNPFRVVIGDDRMWYVVDIDGSIEYGFRETRRDAVLLAIDLYEVLLLSKVSAGLLDLSELRGKDLACMCSLDSPCHVDVLLKHSNK